MAHIVTVEAAVAAVPSGDVTLAIGGNSLHRVPHGLVRAIALRDDLRFHLVKTAGAYDIDLLCLTGRVSAVSAGFIGYETSFGLARHYRRAVESGATEGREHACYTVITALRAAAYGVPFLPVRGLDGSDLPAARGWKWIDDPYGTGDRVVAIPAIRPDVAIIHVQYADNRGNGVILGPKNEDLLMARASRRVILSAERVVATEDLPVPLDHVDIPSVLVDYVVELPGGAWPGSCAGEYDVDADGVRHLIEVSDADELFRYLSSLSTTPSAGGTL